MPAANSTVSFGWTSRLIHWSMAIGVLGMLGFGLYIAGMEASLSNIWLYGLHKSIGLILLGGVFLRIGWHAFTPPPRPLDDGIAWHGHVARLVHRTFYVLLFAIPITGWIGSAASGIDVVFLDRFVLPRIAPVSEAWEDTAFAMHAFLTKFLAGLVLLHVGGAILRRDGTLRRMVTGAPGASAARKAANQ
jgi:cytochrome b561